MHEPKNRKEILERFTSRNKVKGNFFCIAEKVSQIIPGVNIALK